MEKDKKWKNTAPKGINLCRRVDDIHYEIYWNQRHLALFCETVDIPRGRLICNEKMSNSFMEKFPELENNECFVRHFNLQIAYSI